MKIGQKLILGFLGIALLVAIVGYVAINSGQKVGKSYHKVIDDTIPETLALKNIQIASLGMMMEAMSFVAIEDERKFAAAAAAAAGEEEEFLKAKEEIEKWEAEYEKRIAPDDTTELQFVKEIDTAEERIEDLGAEVIALKKKGIAGDEILRKKEELEEAEKSFLELIEKVIAHEEGELGEEHEIVHQGLANSRNIVFGTAGLGFLLAIILGFLIARAISNPITKLKDAATEIGKGKLDTRVVIKSKDEIGFLATSFNKMTEDLSKSRDEIITAKDYTDNIIKSMLDTMIVVDPDANIKTVNKATSDLLGYTENELIGKPVATIFAEEEEEEEEEVTPFKGTRMKKLIDEGSMRDYDMTYKTKAGEKIPVSFSGSVMRDKNGELVGIVGIARDMREIKRLMEKEKELAAAAAADRKKAEELSKAYEEIQQKTEELGSMNEELRTVNEELEQTTKELGQAKTGLEAEVRERTKELEAAKTGLEEQVKIRTVELQKSKDELQKKVTELEKFTEMAMGREARIADLKEEVAKLKEELGRK